MNSRTSFYLGLTIGLIAGIVIGAILSTFIVIGIQETRMGYLEKRYKETRTDINELMSDKDYIDRLRFLIEQQMKEWDYMKGFNKEAIEVEPIKPKEERK